MRRRSSTTDYDHRAKQADPLRRSDRARRDADPRSEVRRGHEENFKVYGVRKVGRQMRRESAIDSRTTRHRGKDRVGWMFALTATACNLTWLPKLVAAA